MEEFIVLLVGQAVVEGGGEAGLIRASDVAVDLAMSRRLGSARD